MESARFRDEEIIGLGVAAFLHLALLGVLLLQGDDGEVQPLPERVTVSLADNVELEAAAPDPVMESREAVAPTLSDTPAPTEAAEVAPAPAPQTAPPPPSRQPRATPPRVRPTQQAQPPRRRPERPASRQKPRPKLAGASRIGSDFLPGAGSNATSSETRAPARTFGRAEQASLRQAIARQLRGHWKAPQGADAEKLVTVLTWRMNKDGSLAGRPKVVRQSGINDANRAQAKIHAERAIRAVQLAAPFKLEPEFYDKWKYIRDWRFDRRL